MVTCYMHKTAKGRALIQVWSGRNNELLSYHVSKTTDGIVMDLVGKGTSLTMYGTSVTPSYMFDMLMFGSTTKKPMYTSDTKGPVVIEEMHDNHLVNAIKKMQRENLTSDPEYTDLVMEAGKRSLSLK